MKNIHFIGNSYTYSSDMPEKICLPMAETAGFDCAVTSVTVGGCELSRFADGNDAPGQKLRAAIAGQHYDMVVLQEQGLRPATEPALFDESVAALLALLRPQAERFMLYATCGRKDGHEDLVELGITGAELIEGLAKSYDAVGEKYGLPVAHSGRAFLAHMAEHPEDELYNADLLHPSPLGSTIAAKAILDVMMQVYGQN